MPAAWSALSLLLLPCQELRGPVVCLWGLQGQLASKTGGVDLGRGLPLWETTP